MTDSTPEPCGCKIQWAYSDTHPPIIHYCPTHAAAFETAAERDRLKEAIRLTVEEYPTYEEMDRIAAAIRLPDYLERAAIAEANEDIFAGRRNALQEKWAKRAKGEA